MKFANKSTVIYSGNELLKQYSIDEIKSIFAIASSSYTLKANLGDTEKGVQYSILTRLNEYVEHWLQKLALANRKAEMLLRLTLFGIKCGVLSRGTLEVYKNKALNKLRQLLPCY